MSKEYRTFDKLMHELIKVPHSELKAKLDAEKASKKGRTKRDRKDRKKH